MPNKPKTPVKLQPKTGTKPMSPVSNAKSAVNKQKNDLNAQKVAENKKKVEENAKKYSAMKKEFKPNPKPTSTKSTPAGPLKPNKPLQTVKVTPSSTSKKPEKPMYNDPYRYFMVGKKPGEQAREVTRSEYERGGQGRIKIDKSDTSKINNLSVYRGANVTKGFTPLKTQTKPKKK